MKISNFLALILICLVQFAVCFLASADQGSRRVFTSSVASHSTLASTQSQNLTPRIGSSGVNPVDGAKMVYVPAGSFSMGVDPNDPNYLQYFYDAPKHTVALNGFWIYRDLVTVAEYRKFCNATGRSMPTAPSWGWSSNQPVVNVFWDDAEAYAAWAHAKLPTEAQWEKAARGTDQRSFPWGNSWAAEFCAHSLSQFALSEPKAVGRYTLGQSPYGVLDMAGNVNEWCNDWFDPLYYESDDVLDPKGPLSGHGRVIRGGSWKDTDPNLFRTTLRRSQEPNECSTQTGFRCIVPSRKSEIIAAEVHTLTDHLAAARKEPVLGLVAVWQAKDGFADSVSGIVATPFGGASIMSIGTAKVYDFSGQNPGLGIPDVSRLQLTGSLTVAAHIYIRSITSGIHNMIFFRGDDRGGLDPYTLSIEYDGKLAFHISSDGDVNDVDIESPMPLPLNRWLSVAASLDLQKDTAVLYVNGGAVAWAQTSTVPLGALDINSNPGCGIGNCNGSGKSGFQMPIDGQLDDIRLYSRALDPEEIRQIAGIL